MDQAELEVRLSARLHARFDGSEPSERLFRRIADARSSDRGPARRRPATWALVAVVLVAVLAGFVVIATQGRPGVAGPGPTASALAPSASASSSPPADVPFRISVATARSSPGPTTTISAPSDCTGLPSDWLSQVCSLTLRPDWQSIIGPTDPLGPPVSAGTEPTQVGTASWWAAIARANIDGDTSICADASMRWWITLGSGLGAAPQPGSTPAPLHPVAECLRTFRSTVAHGSFTLGDGDVSIFTFYVDPAATARVALGAPPSFDPAFGCDPRSMTREACDALLAAVTPVLGDRQGQVTMLALRGGSFECTTSASPCPPPSGGSWLGNVVAETSENAGFAFDVALIGGQAVLTEVPYTP